jgi:predicted RNase H-like HicB family nuclease
MKINFHIEYFEENGTIVAISPELQVSSFGDTLKEAEQSIKEALELFIEGCEEMGTLNEVLEESGFIKIGDEWLHRKPIKTTQTAVQLHQRIASYA